MSLKYSIASVVLNDTSNYLHFNLINYSNNPDSNEKEIIKVNSTEINQFSPIGDDHL